MAQKAAGFLSGPTADESIAVSLIAPDCQATDRFEQSYKKAGYHAPTVMPHSQMFAPTRQLAACLCIQVSAKKTSTPLQSIMRWFPSKFKVPRLYPPNEGSLDGCECPVRIKPQTHRLDSRHLIAGAPPPARVSGAYFVASRPASASWKSPHGNE